MNRKVVFYILMWAIVIVVPLAFLEGFVRIVDPQPELFPRYRASVRYGHGVVPMAEMINQLPGQWRFVYHTNEYGYRAPMPAVSNVYDLPYVVVLGDSFTFGVGVNDGEEYCRVLAKMFQGQAEIVNLGVAGFGLTNEIRTFYEFGVVFQPSVVVLQFASNDPVDNFYEKVTTFADGRFRFHIDRSMGGWLGWVKDWLGGSILQRSALYNFVRNHASEYWRERTVSAEAASVQEDKVAFYNELLRDFAQDLKRRSIPFVFFGVNGQLAEWPGILAEVERLDREGLLHYLPSEPWFAGFSDYGTPEGHSWGAKGHAIVAAHLSQPLRDLLPRTNSVSWRSSAPNAPPL
jgi:hypothetical protein